MTESTPPQLFMLCGIPTSGKSTYVSQLAEYMKNVVILSTDNYIEKEAEALGLTYNEVFENAIGNATEQMGKDLRLALTQNSNIIWDQTNLTPKVRKRKLAKIPPSYEKTAVWFDITLKEALQRNSLREAKYIPLDILKRMHASFTPPVKSEGFTRVYKPL